MSMYKEEYYMVYRAIIDSGHSHQIACEAAKLHVQYLQSVREQPTEKRAS